MGVSPGLPLPRQSFVGREAALCAIDRAREAARLVTIVGPAGAGKTRVAIEWARARAGARIALFADLGGIDHLAGLCREIGDLLDLPLLGGSPEDHRARIARSLAARGRVLLVCDDLDAIVGVAREAFELWTRDAPELQILATSRQRLGARGEHVIELLPLTPEEGRALFTERARALVPDWSPTREDTRAIDAIVERVDGLPLAIELAAARIPMAAPIQIAELLTRQLDLLADARRPVARHRALRAAIDYSFGLLEPELRLTLARAGLFEAPFTLEVAAESLGGAEPDPVKRRIATLDRLQALVERSLVRVLRDEDGESRFGLLASVAEYAREQLPLLAERGAAERDRARAVLAHAERLLPRSRREPAALRALARETRELLGVVDRALEDGCDEDAARGVVALGRVCIMRGPSHELLERIERLTARLDALDAPLRADLFTTRAGVAITLGDLAGAVAHAERALELEEQLGRPSALLQRARAASYRQHAGDDALMRTLLADPPSVRHLEPLHATIVLNILGMGLQRQERFTEARPFLERALAIAREHGLREKEGHLLGYLAWCDLAERRYPEARAAFERGSALLSEMGETRMAIAYAGDSGLVLLEEGAHDAARERLAQAAQGHRQLADRWLEAEGVGHLGCVELVTERFEAAARCFAEAEHLHRETGDRQRAAFFAAARAPCLAELGHRHEAERALERAAEVLEPIGRAAVTSVCTAHVSLLRDPSSIDRAREVARAELEGRRPEARILARALSRAVERAEKSLLHSTHWIVARDGAWHRREHAPVRIDSAPQRRLLAFLARARLESPGVALDVDRLFEAGWPGETADRERRTNRVRVMLTRLRAAGLREVLLARKDGYLLDPAMPLRLE